MSLQHIIKNSSVSGKEPLASQLANGELSINYHADGPFLCCKDTAGNVRRVAGVWVATTAPSTPFPGELWLDTGITPSQLKVYKNTTDNWVFAGAVNPATTTYAGIVQLATNGETQIGTNVTSAVTPASLQSKISDSTTTVSSTTIASSTAVKSVGDLASAALPKSGGIITGTLEIGNTGQIRFEGNSDDAYETTLAVEDPTAPRTITLPDRSGTVITTGDTGTVTNPMLAGSIADSKLSTITTAGKVSLSALNIDGATDIGGALSDADLFIVDDGANGTNRKTPATRISDYTFGKVNGAVTIANNGTSSLGTGVIVNSNVSNTAAIAGTKVSPDFGSQNITTTGSLGIGTSSPSSLLHLAASSGTIQTQFNNGGTSSFIGHDSAYTGLDIAGGGGIKFRYFNGAVFAEAARFDTTGRLGIGTSSPQSLLNLSTPSTGTSTESLRIEGGQRSSDSFATGFRVYTESTTSDSNRHLRIVCNGSTGFSIQPYETSSGNAAADSNLYLCPAGGNVGIGTSSPGANHILEIEGGQKYLAVRTNAGAGGAANPSSSDGLFFTWNRSNGGGESNIVYGTGLGTSPGLTFGSWNGTTYAEAIRIDSSGRLLVGTSTARSNFFNTPYVPSQFLIETTGQGVEAAFIRNETDNNGAALILAKSKGSASGSNALVASGDNLGEIYFMGNDGSEFVTGGIISCVVDGTPGANDMPGRLVFSTTADGSALPTERMRITSAGALYVGETSGGAATIAGTVRCVGFNTRTGVTGSLGANIFNIWWDTSNARLYIDNTNLGNISFSSDYRIKQNVQTQTQQAIERIKLLRPVTYELKDYGELFKADGITREGFIAHEVQEVIPSGAEGEKDEEDRIQNLRLDAIVSVLTKALQEAVEKIETLETKVAALEAA